MRAIEDFDINRGIKFSTFAVIWIKQMIARYLANSERTIRRPVGVEVLIGQVQSAQSALSNTKGTYTNEDIAKFLNISIKKVNKALDVIDKGLPLSLDRTLKEDSDESFVSFIATDDNIEDSVIEKVYQSNIFELAKRFLDEREYEIICMRLGKYHNHIYSLEEVSLRFNITRERVRQIENRALKKLSSPTFKKAVSTLDKPIDRPLLSTIDNEQTLLKKSLYAYFTDYSKIDVDNAFKTLSDKYQKLILEIYGESLDEYHIVSQTKCHYFETIIIKYLNKVLFTNKINSIDILKYFSNFSKEEIILAINELNKSQKDIIYRKYGQYLDNNYDLDFESAITLYVQILPLIGKNLHFFYQLNHFSIFKIFPNISKAELLYFISKLPSKEQNLLYQKYGLTLEESNLSLNNLLELKRIINKLNYELKQTFYETLRKNIYELLTNDNEEEISNYIEKLDRESQDLIYARYSFDISNDPKKYLDFITNIPLKMQYRLVYNIIPQLKRIVPKKNNNKGKDFYSRFGKYTKEQIDYIFNSLTDKDKELIYIRYGRNLSEVYEYKNNNIRNKVETVLQTIRYQLLKCYSNETNLSTIKSFYDIFKISVEDADIVMQNLTNDEKEDLYAFFGYDLTNPKPVPINREFRTYIQRKLFPKIRKMLNKPIFNALKLYNELSNISLTKQEFIVISLKLGYHQSKIYTNEEIAKLLNLSLEEVNIILEKYKEIELPPILEYSSKRK